MANTGLKYNTGDVVDFVGKPHKSSGSNVFLEGWVDRVEVMASKSKIYYVSYLGLET